MFKNILFVALLIPGIIFSEVSVKIKSTARCSYGDTDLMALDLNEHKERGEEAKLLISLESADGKTKEVQEFSGKSQYKFSGKELNNGLYKLIICKDNSNTGSCSDKPAVNFNESMKRYSYDWDETEKKMKVKESNSNSPLDKIYFIYPVLIENNVLKKAISSEVAKLDSELDSILNDRTKASKLIEEIKTIQSEEPKVEKKSITIDLPHLDKGKCS